MCRRKMSQIDGIGRGRVTGAPKKNVIKLKENGKTTEP